MTFQDDGRGLHRSRRLSLASMRRISDRLRRSRLGRDMFFAPVVKTQSQLTAIDTSPGIKAQNAFGRRRISQTQILPLAGGVDDLQ